MTTQISLLTGLIKLGFNHAKKSSDRRQVVRPALMEQLARVSAVLKEEQDWADLASVQAYHFQPSGFAFPATLLYPLPAGGVTSRAEARLAARRAAAHELLGVPSDRPQLKVASALGCGVQTGLPQDGRLRDVHLNVQPSKIKNGTKHLVQGSYAYHHYMQVIIVWMHAVVIDAKHWIMKQETSYVLTVCAGQVQRRRVGVCLSLPPDIVELVCSAGLHRSATP